MLISHVYCICIICSLEKVQERIEADQTVLSEELSIQLDEADSINKEMAKLKVR